MKKLLVKDAEDTSRVNHLNELCLAFFRAGNTDSALQLGKASSTLAQKLNYTKGLWEANSNLGAISYSRHDLKSSLNYYYKALSAESNGDEGSRAHKVIVYDNIGLVFEAQSNFAKASESYTKAMKLIKETGNKKLQAYTMVSIAGFHLKLGNEAKAQDYYVKAIRIYEELGCKSEMAKAYSNLGVLFKSGGDYSRALDCYYKALKYASDAADRNVQARTACNISAIYRERAEYSKALQYALQSLNYAKESGSLQLQSAAAGDVGLIYWKKCDYTRALKYYEEANEFAKKANDKNSQAVIADNMGVICESQGNYPKALEYEFTALNLSTAIGDKEGIAIEKNKIGEIYASQKDYKEAEKYILEALYLADSVQLLATIKESSRNLSGLFSEKGDWEKAYKVYLQYVAASFKLSTNNATLDSAERQSRSDYETQVVTEKINDDRDSAMEIIAVKRKRMFVALVSLLIVAGGASGALGIRLNRLKSNDGERASKDLFVLYMPHRAESGKFCRMEQMNDTSLIVIGSQDSVARVSQMNVLDKLSAEPASIPPEQILARVRILVERQTAEGSDRSAGLENVALLVADRKDCRLCWDGSEIAHWVMNKSSLFESAPEKYSESLSEGKKSIHKFQAKKGDTLYIFTSGWVSQLGHGDESVGTTLFRNTLKKIYPFAMEEQRKALLQLADTRLEDKSHTEDMLVIGLKI